MLVQDYSPHQGIRTLWPNDDIDIDWESWLNDEDAEVPLPLGVPEVPQHRWSNPLPNAAIRDDLLVVNGPDAATYYPLIDAIERQHSIHLRSSHFIRPPSQAHSCNYRCSRCATDSDSSDQEDADRDDENSESELSAPSSMPGLVDF